jgi:hypothetical protein
METGGRAWWRTGNAWTLWTRWLLGAFLPVVVAGPVPRPGPRHRHLVLLEEDTATAAEQTAGVAPPTAQVHVDAVAATWA